MSVTGTQGMLPSGILYTKLWYPGALNSCAYQLLHSWTPIAQNPKCSYHIIPVRHNLITLSAPKQAVNNS